VRTIIADLMDPIADRAVKNQSELKKVHLAVDQMHKRLDEVERVMKVDLNLKTFINDIKKRQSLIVSLQIVLDPLGVRRTRDDPEITERLRKNAQRPFIIKR